MVEQGNWQCLGVLSKPCDCSGVWFQISFLLRWLQIPMAFYLSSIWVDKYYSNHALSLTYLISLKLHNDFIFYLPENMYQYFLKFCQREKERHTVRNWESTLHGGMTTLQSLHFYFGILDSHTCTPFVLQAAAARSETLTMQSAVGHPATLPTIPPGGPLLCHQIYTYPHMTFSFILTRTHFLNNMLV